MLEKIWKDVVGFENYYLVSNFGEIVRTTKGRLVKAWVENNGYVRVGLSLGGVRSTLTVHSIVAAAFIGPRPKGLDINHIDGNKLNNCCINLEYKTRKENVEHAYQTGLSTNFGENNYYSKLTTEDVLEIRRLHREGKMGYRRLAKLFEIDSRHVSKIVKRLKWKHV